LSYDPVTKQYYVLEKVGNQYYRKPTYLTFDELMQMQSQSSEDDYWRKACRRVGRPQPKLLRPKAFRERQFVSMAFSGMGKIDIRPQGNVDITAGYAVNPFRIPPCRKAQERQVSLILI